MTVLLDHTIVAARDKERSARFMAEVFGLPAPTLLGKFAVVQVGVTSLSYVDTDEAIHSQHYAFLVSEKEFDAIFARVRERNLQYWADPRRRKAGRMNTWDDGRGVYFDDPNGHLLEIITRRYGSGGTEVSEPHPLIAPTLSVERGAQGAKRTEAADDGSLAGAELPRGVTREEG